MIQANELRIGNVVMWQGAMIRLINPIMLVRCFNKIDEGRVSPVQLTPDMLGKCKLIKYFHLSNDNCPYDCEYYYKPAEELNWVPVPYLHTLQNLYFALTGTELEINL